MSIIHPGLFLIMRRFPTQRNALRCLYMNNSTFQAVCHDYQECEMALAHWRQSPEDQAQERYFEYLELLQSLELEIKEFFKKQTVYGNPRPQ